MTKFHIFIVAPIQLFVQKKKWEFEAKQARPTEINPLSVPFRPAGINRPDPEKDCYESPAEMANLGGRTQVLRPKRQPSTNTNTQTPNHTVQTNPSPPSPSSPQSSSQISTSSSVSDQIVQQLRRIRAAVTLAANNLPSSAIPQLSPSSSTNQPLQSSSSPSSSSQSATTRPSTRNDNTNSPAVNYSPPLQPISDDHFHLYISAKRKKTNSAVLPDEFKTGSAFRIFTPGVDYEGKYKFFGFVDRCQATQYALIQAIECLMESRAPRTITIITDELECARFIEERRLTVNPQEHKLVQILSELNCNLTIRRKLKGDKNYSEVEKKAVKMCLNSSRPVYFFYNKRFVKNEANKWAERKFAEIYKVKTRGKTIQKFFGDANHKPKHFKTNYVLTQFFTGHGCFREYLARFKVIRDGSCICDRTNNQPPSQTVEHVLLKCSKYSLVTKQAFEQADLPWQCLMQLVELPQAFKVFCEVAEKIHEMLKVDNGSNESDEDRVIEDLLNDNLEDELVELVDRLNFNNLNDLNPESQDETPPIDMDDLFAEQHFDDELFAWEDIE